MLMSLGLSRRVLSQATSTLNSSSSGFVVTSSSIQVRTLTHKDLRDPTRVKPKPWPYKKVKYGLLHSIYDDVTHRFDENTKIITVDGPPTGNKAALCKSIADALEMHYIPSPHLDAFFTDDYGRDKRAVNYKVPPKMRTFDIHQFMERPHHFLTGRMQFMYYFMRLQQYFDTMNHLLNTGQGVVMHRSIWSDIVFQKTLVDMNMMRSGVYDVIEESKNNGTFECFKPHVCIYLDMTPQTIIQNAKARNVNNEVGSPFFSEKCLNTMISNYKIHFLDPISVRSEVLIYDWNEEGCHEDVIDDICDLNLEAYHKCDKKLHEWNAMAKEDEWKRKRMLFSKYGAKMINWAQNVHRRDVEELWPNSEDLDGYYEAMKNEPGRYQVGYNADMGESFMFRTQYVSHHV